MNIFKLVNLHLPHKIDLPVGTFTFGRGKLLECNDKRVSRNHGQLIVTDNSITLQALSSNPCFYQRNDSEDKELLTLDCSAVLMNGDRFGVLPDTCWYEVVHCPTPLAPQTANILNTDVNNSDSDQNTQPLNSTLINTTKDDATHDCTSLDNHVGDENVGKDDGSSSNDPVNDNNPTKNCTGQEPLDFNINETMDEVEDGSDNAADNSASILPSNQDLNNESDVPIPQKRCSPTELDAVDVKRVKIEPSDTNGNNGDQVQPGPSSNNMANTNNKDEDNKVGLDNLKSPPKHSTVQLRERCMYGASCYRRNPQHKAQFSHPRDADWGPGAQAPCPYGAGCARRDPRHWRDHSHPAGTAPPPPPGMRVVERYGNIFYINAHSVNIYDDHVRVEDSDGDSVDYDYEF